MCKLKEWTHLKPILTVLSLSLLISLPKHLEWGEPRCQLMEHVRTSVGAITIPSIIRVQNYHFKQFLAHSCAPAFLFSAMVLPWTNPTNFYSSRRPHHLPPPHVIDGELEYEVKAILKKWHPLECNISWNGRDAFLMMPHGSLFRTSRIVTTWSRPLNNAIHDFLDTRGQSLDMRAQERLLHLLNLPYHPLLSHPSSSHFEKEVIGGGQRCKFPWSRPLFPSRFGSYASRLFRWYLVCLDRIRTEQVAFCVTGSDMKGYMIVRWSVREDTS